MLFTAQEKDALQPKSCFVNTVLPIPIEMMRTGQTSTPSPHLQHIPVWMFGGCFVDHQGPPDETTTCTKQPPLKGTPTNRKTHEKEIES